MSAEDNDIELLAGQVWNAPDRPRVIDMDFGGPDWSATWPLVVIDSTPGGCERSAWAERFLAAKEAQDQEIEAARKWMGGDQWSEEDIAAMKERLKSAPVHGYVTLPQHLRMQAAIVRRAPLPEESENDHLPPHYSDMLKKKGGA